MGVCKRLLRGVLVSALVTGCTTVGPNFSEPKIEWLQRLETGIYGNAITYAPQSTLSLGQWWQHFNDPVLSQLIEIARRENLNLRLAGLRVLESRALVGVADAAQYPQVTTLDAEGAWLVRDAGASNDDFRQWNSGLKLGWELDFWGKFQRAIESADAAFMASVLNQRDIQVLVTAQVADVYWRFRVIEERIAILRRNAQRQKRSFDITRQMFESGQQSELDLQQAKTQYLSTLAGLPGLEQALAQTGNALSVLLARPPGEIPELTTDEFSLPVAQAVPVADLPASLIQRRPDVRASLWAAASASAQIGIAESAYYPSLALGGSLAWAGTSPGAGTAGTAGIGPALTWTIFDWGRIENSIRREDARFEQAVTAYQSTVLSAAREISDAVIAVDKTAAQRALLEETVTSSERALALANSRYREGYADFQRVLDAQRVVFSQADRKLQNDAAHLSALVALYKALGGGWQDQTINEMISPAVRATMQRRTDWGQLLEGPVLPEKLEQ